MGKPLQVLWKFRRIKPVSFSTIELDNLLVLVVRHSVLHPRRLNQQPLQVINPNLCTIVIEFSFSDVKDILRDKELANSVILNESAVIASNQRILFWDIIRHVIVIISAFK